MPTVTISKTFFEKSVGKKFTFDELEELCFEFGIEVEETEDLTQYAFETPSNRYDLLGLEGLVYALGNYLGTVPIPTFSIAKTEKREVMTVLPSITPIRPFVVAAILRDIEFTPETYANFIDLQEKLHQNICRKRTLVAIGTHDYDTIKGPFRYEAKAPADIKFAPLNETTVYNGVELMEHYSTDLHLKPFLHIIKDSPVYPVIYDSNDVVLSLPPIINGNHSKICLSTKNVFIECTATDLTKAKITLNTVVALFSKYCKKAFTVEEVEIKYPNGEIQILPDISTHEVETNIDYVNKLIGISITPTQAVDLLKKMGMHSVVKGNNEIVVTVPITRSDILHQCDIAEDLAIAFGYNNITEFLPPTFTIGKQQILNKYSDLLRQELANAGFKEALNFILCSISEISSDLLVEESSNITRIANPKTKDFQTARNTLLPGILKNIQSNKSNRLPLSIFELGDVVEVSDTVVGAINKRMLAAAYTNSTSSGFEIIHGILDYVMTKMNIPLDVEKGYSIQPSTNPTFFPNRQTTVLFKGDVIGRMGVVHPDVLRNFEWSSPTSFLEIEIEPLIREVFIE